MKASVFVFLGTAVLIVAIAVVVVRIAGERARRRRQTEQAMKASRLLATGHHQKVVSKLIAEGRFREAIDVLVSSGDFRAAARVALRMGDPLRAGELFERASDFEGAALAFLKIPDFRRAAESFSRAGNHEKAAEIYLQIEDLWAAAEEMVAMGRRKQAAAIHRQLGNDIMAARLMAEALREEGDLKGAAQAFIEAGDLEAAAQCQAELGLYREAAETYQRASRPDLAAALLEKAGATTEAAALYEEAGDYAAAARLYQRIRDLSGEVQALVAAGEYLAAGRLLYRQGALEQAEEVLKLATPGDKGYLRACLLLGRIMEQTGRRREATKYYALYVERGEPSKRTQQVWTFLANFFERENCFDVAIQCLRKLEKAGLLEPSQEETLKRLVERMSKVETRESELGGAGPSRAQEIPSQLANRYQVLSRLGEGGTAVVLLAHDRLLKRNVVLKMLNNPQLPPELAEEYFMREAQIVASMSHPNIVTVYDVGNAGGRMYIVMEYIEGRSLDVILNQRQGKGLPLAEVVRLAKQIGEALAYAHERKVIHRDLKPGNVMVLPDGSAKLMDFGMAKALEVHRDRSLYICGTPDYMSPEQEAGEDLTVATDIYSFGLVILESLLGHLPSAATALTSRQKRLAALAKSNLPEGVKKVIAQCLEVDPRKRPASARLVAAALEKAAEGKSL